MKLKCLGCQALARLAYYGAAQSPHIVDISLFRLGLHNKPPELRALLQAEVDTASAEGYDAIVMAYGLCGKVTEGLVARNLPVVIPRAHDCITLFLGSRSRYTEQFDQCPGTYWYALDYVERKDSPGTSLSLATGTDIASVYDEYVEKYGQDNADYLMEVMGAWQSHYQRAAFIDMGVGDSNGVEHEAHAEANRRGWTFERMSGDLALISRLLNGEWEKDFLVLQPGQRVKMSHDDDVVCGV